MTRRNKRNEKDTWRRTTKATGPAGTYLPIIFITPSAPPNHFKWQEFTLSVSLKVFIRQRYKPDTPEVVMEVKRHFLVPPNWSREEVSLIVGGQPLVFRCHADRIVRVASLATCDKSQGNV